MKFAKFLIAAALVLPFFAHAQDSMPTDPSAPPAAPTMNDPALEAMPADGAITQPPPATPASELGETKKAPKKKAKKAPKKEKKSSSKKHKDSKKAKKNKKKKHHDA